MSIRATTASLLFSLPLLSSVAACSGGASTTSASATTADGGTEPPPASAVDGGSGPAPSTPKQQCEALIACVADIDPGSAGALVTLYGDASNCWKGGESDAEACGKACAKNLEDRPECMAEALDRHFLALCTMSLASQAIRYDVELAFDQRKGGAATFRPVPIDADRYQRSDALMTQPKLALTIASDGARGESSTPFDLPGEAFGAAPDAHVTSFAVQRLRVVEKGHVCSDVEATITSPYSTLLRGACMYFPLADGAAIPEAITAGDIQYCQIPK